jgi:CHAT domain-containing protein
MQFYKYFAPAALVLCAIVSGSRSPVPVSAGSAPVAQADPSSALSTGRSLLKQGHADQALNHLQTALTLYTQANNQRGIAAARDALGDLYLLQGQYKVALEHFEKAYEAFTAAAIQDQKTQAVTSTVASQAGATTSAAAETAASTADNSFNANLMLAKIGDTSFRLGEMSKAGTAYARMTVKKPESAAAKATRRFGGLGGIVGSISTGRADIATPVSSTIGFLEVKKEMDEYRVAIVYMTYELGTGRIAFANNDLPTAKKHFENAMSAGGGSLPIVAKLGQTRRFRTAARTSLGDVALKESRYKDAAKLYEAAQKGADEDKRLDLMWPAQRGRGRSLWLQAAQEKDSAKLREQALAAYRDSLNTIEQIRAGSVRADESRTTFLATTKDVYDEAVAAFAEMAVSVPGAVATGSGGTLSGKALDYAAEALRISEQARARSLLDMLAEVNAQITAGVPADLLKRKQENLNRQQEIAAQLTGVSVATDQKAKPSDLEKELETLQTEFDQIENQIRTASPRYASLTATQPSSLADIQQKVLDDNTVLLEYALGNDASYLFAVTRAGLSVFKLPAKAELNRLSTDFREQLIPPKLQRRLVGIDVADEQRGLGLTQGPAENVQPFVTASHALYQAAVAPAASLIGDKRVLVVADGALNYIPFEALVKTSGAADYASLDYLIKSNEIVYAPSASVIAAIRQQQSAATNVRDGSILVIADPVFSTDDARLTDLKVARTPTGETRGLGLALESAVTDMTGFGTVGLSPASNLRLARLPGTRAEAEAIAASARTGGAKADVWMDLGASEENIHGSNVANYRIVHIATHGLLNVERPQFTGVVLSLVGNTSADGFLRTDEIFNLKMAPSLVMLSACETGLGKEKRGEGVMGLTRAFMYAGAPTVGVSLWSVADKSTAELMTDFYQRFLAAGSPSRSGALRDAQLAMISGKKYSAPFYWAPFVLVGEWK